MPLELIKCPKCGGKASEYDKDKWACLKCGQRFIYTPPLPGQVVYQSPPPVVHERTIIREVVREVPSRPPRKRKDGCGCLVLVVTLLIVISMVARYATRESVTNRPSPTTNSVRERAIHRTTTAPAHRTVSSPPAPDQPLPPDPDATATLWGLAAKAPADRVVYIVDKSGSMATMFPYVKAELVRSISQLTPRQSYTVIFFADGKPTELTINSRAELHNATGNNKDVTKKWVDEQIAQSFSGRTDPRQALERAFKTPGGPPQLIYLLTDGIFPTETLDTLRRLNADKKVRINTIMFKDRPLEAEKLLKQIAGENGGVYKFISEEQLADY